MELEHVTTEEPSPGLKIELKTTLEAEENSVEPDNEGVITINSIHAVSKV